jgi:3-oxoacyl-(acyl-carrier-protein) synthase
MTSGLARVVITGMAVNTPLGDTLGGHLDALLAGRSAIAAWKGFDSSNIDSKIGGDLSGYDARARLESLAGASTSAATAAAFLRAQRLVDRAPWSAGLSVAIAMDAWADAGLFDAGLDRARAGAIVAGHNLQHRYHDKNFRTFQHEPDFIDPFYAFHSLDTMQTGCVSEALQVRGTGMIVGAACASGLYALRSALDEIRFHGMQAVITVGAVCDFAPIDMHAMGLIGAISQGAFDADPARASRPFDVNRNGFVPAHGGGAVVLEALESALRRNARIYGELVAVETSSDASHLPNPSEDGEAAAMQRVLTAAGIEPEQVDYVNGHFTSTPAGDIAEINAIKRVFGDHAGKLKLNATKSLLGHTMSACGIVELVGTLLQMRASRLHGSINIEELDPAIDLDVCANSAVHWPVRYLLKNAFGFGGLNASAVVSRYAG